MSRRYWGAVAAVLVAEAALLAWNAWHYDWLRGYDAFANERYADVVSREYRLPSEAESGVWHTPPLWFALAGALGRLTTALGLGHAQRPGQLLAAAAGLVTCVLVLLLARVLWPERRVLHLVALVFVAASPALVRASAMYHPETLAVALATGGVLVAARALRTRWTLGSAVAAGALLGLACLTRAWAVPVLVAVLVVAGLHAWDTRRWAPVAACAAVALALLAPWLVNQELAHGSAARVQPSSAVRLRAGAAAGELLPRPALAPRARASDHAALSQRARPPSLRGLVGRLGPDLGQPAAARPGGTAPVRGRVGACTAGGRRRRPVGARARGADRARPARGSAAVAVACAAPPLGRRGGGGVRRLRGALSVDGRRHDQGDVPAHGAAGALPSPRRS